MEQDIIGSTLLDQVYPEDTVKKVLDACVNGKYLPEAFGLDSSIGFQDLEDQIVAQATYDVTGAFDLEAMNAFRSFVQTFDKNSYKFTVDTLIIDYNSEYTNTVSRTVLAANPTFPFVPSGVNDPEIAAYTALRDYYDQETSDLASASSAFEAKAAAFKADATAVLNDYDVLDDYATNTLQIQISNLKCSLNPVFEQSNILLYGNQTAWCNEVGQLYGQMKQKSCRDLFTNFEYTNRSLLVIAIFSTFIGFLSVALGRRIDRQFDLFGKKDWNFNSQNIQLGERWS